MKRLALLLAAEVACVMGMKAQKVVTGTVVDKEKQPMVGIYVTPESGGETVATDIDGRFKVMVNEGEYLGFESVGMMSKWMPAVDSMVVVMGVRDKYTSRWNWRRHEWKHILLAEYGMNVMGETIHSIGLRYGMCKYAGWYVGVRYMSSGFTLQKAELTMRDGVIEDKSGVRGVPVTNGFSINQFGFSAGVMWRMYIPLYGYAGVGYGYRMTDYKTTSGEWYRRAEDKSNLVTAEVGLVGDIRNFTISAGCELVFAGSMEVYPKIGIGFALPGKSNKKRR